MFPVVCKTVDNIFLFSLGDNLRQRSLIFLVDHLNDIGLPSQTEISMFRRIPLPSSLQVRAPGYLRKQLKQILMKNVLPDVNEPVEESAS